MIEKRGPGALAEARYGEAVRRMVPGQARALPRVIRFDEAESLLVVENVRDRGERLDALFDAGRVSADVVFALGEFLGAVHRATAREAPRLEPLFPSDSRRARGEEVFVRPFAPGSELEPRLRMLADEALGRPKVRERIAELHATYSSSRESLLHGDLQAANVVVQSDRPRITNAEHAHVGDPAFDLGVAFAHLHVQRVRARDTLLCEACEKALVDGYAPDRTTLGRARRYAGVEILSRAIGAGRLLLLGTTARAERALELGTALVSGE